jgi:hypothetical protein
LTPCSPTEVLFVMDFSGFCPHCLQHTNFTGILPHGVVPYRRQLGESYYFLRCNNNLCRMPIIRCDNGITFPIMGPSSTSEHLPEGIRSDVHEAKVCLSANAYNASVIMTRKAIESAAILKGARRGRRLIDKLRDLRDQGILNTIQYEMAEATRWVGNAGAHPNRVQGVTKGEAEAAIKLVELLFDTLFTAPVLIEIQRRHQR